MINYGKQHIDKSDIYQVTKVLKSDYITQGRNILKFENALSNYFGSKYCSVVSSGTAALHLLGLALGWKENDIIITTPLSFLATSNAIIYSGAIPCFVDIDADTNNIDTNLLIKKIKHLKKKRKKIKAIICTDFAGYPCDWKKLSIIGKKYNITLINDCCHAMGASIDGNKQYAIKYADYVTLSFHAVKNITTGEGGAVLTNDKKIRNNLNLLRTHGVKKSPRFKPWYYEMVKLGYNYRITDFQCALGISQLKKIDKFVKKRIKISKIYERGFKNLKYCITPKVKKNVQHAFHIYPLKILFNKIKINKLNLFKKLNKKQINLQVHYIPIHLQPYYKKKYNFKKGDFPVAEDFYEKEVSLPIYYDLSKEKVKSIIKKIKYIINN